MPGRIIGRSERIGVALGLMLLWFAAPAFRQMVEARAGTGPLPPGHEKPADLPGLHNVFRLSEKLYAGSAPEGEEAFEALQRLGIRTLITVDGARPDVERARRFGMRYVHIPFGYDGCPAPTANAVVRAVRDLPGPIYLHCHHGKHRGPAAAAFARIALDGLSHEEAIQEMERAGTGKEYIGLYADVRAYRPPKGEELDRLETGFPEVAPTPPLMEAMVAVDRRFEGLALCRKEGWKAPAQHPDLSPTHEALQLRELFTELSRAAEAQKRPPGFRDWMRDSERDAGVLEEALRAGNMRRADQLFGRVAAGCGACHAKYRNVPQDEQVHVQEDYR